MLQPCPECERPISDRAAVCPGCGFPCAEHRAELDAAASLQRDRASRTHVGETDCLRCLARGFRMIPDDEPEAGSFEWCEVCGHSGRVALVQSSRGYFAISPPTLDAFLRAACDELPLVAVRIGDDVPPPRYPLASQDGASPQDDDRESTAGGGG
ncbi:MAG: hypothetical protein IPH07_01000 [Deltaproteobacteria bacterium]|nr:hypothetical protein [Deltaproteobacteria bacterium]MBK8717250.1 hypothetical protein [Deltaproteobacteria bacterium]MBP7286128.1 hypothetical protein [Nannocystaceae bacterium]